MKSLIGISQMSFYIKPAIASKINFISSDFRKFSTTRNLHFNTENFNYKNNNFLFSSKTIIASYGISFGLESNSKKNSFELGIIKDQYAFNYSLIPFSKFENYNNNYTFVFNYWKINISNNLYLFNKKNLKSSFSYGINLNIISTYSNQYHKNLVTENITINDSTNLTLETSILGVNKKTLSLNIGFSNDLYFKQKYILTFDVYLNKNLGRNLINEVTSNILTSNSYEKKMYTINQYSSGNGLYIQFSRKLNIKKQQIETE